MHAFLSDYVAKPVQDEALFAFIAEFGEKMRAWCARLPIAPRPGRHPARGLSARASRSSRKRNHDGKTRYRPIRVAPPRDATMPVLARDEAISVIAKSHHVVNNLPLD
ncbi:MAG: hypothetical protein Udaeo2_30290 [Candidatus Udaeobacter sp.]|nr:MAG: hypothetical protein Udaeo2_30290 [Candidatus Udaeobacter sp.]